MTVRYMIATRALHKLGDISRDEPDLCWIDGEDDEAYIGAWVTGFGYVNVRFPKATTRELTDAEREHYDGRQLAMGDRPVGRIRLADTDIASEVAR